MADFGIGSASGLLSTAIKTIWNLYKVRVREMTKFERAYKPNFIQKLKANKAAAKELAQKCSEIQAELVRLFEDAERSGLTEGEIHDT